MPPSCGGGRRRCACEKNELTVLADLLLRLSGVLPGAIRAKSPDSRSIRRLRPARRGVVKRNFQGRWGRTRWGSGDCSSDHSGPPDRYLGGVSRPYGGCATNLSGRVTGADGWRDAGGRGPGSRHDGWTARAVGTANWEKRNIAETVAGLRTRICVFPCGPVQLRSSTRA